METRAHLQIAVQKRYKAPQDRVFDAWLDPEVARKFLFATPEGTMIQAESASQEKGEFRFVDRRNGKDLDHRGTWLVIDRPHRLVFEFAVDGGDRSRVELDFTAEDGETLVTLTHELLPDRADLAQKAEEGWRSILDALDGALEETG